MSNIQNIPLNEKLRDSNPKINQNFQNLNTGIGNVEKKINDHINSSTAHKAEDISYSGQVPGTDVKEAIDNVNGRISDIVAQSGDDNTEIVDARGGYPVLGDRLNASDAQLVDIAINVKNYGAIGDGTLHLLSEIYSTVEEAQVKYPKVTSLSQSIDWAAIQTALDDGMGKRVFAPKGVYVITDGLEMGETHLFGDGVDKWVPAFPDQTKEESSGTHFRFVGTGPKIHELKDTSDMRVAGGWRTNGSSVNGEDAYYKLLSFMNEDANGTTPATTKKFSAAIRIVPTTQNWSIKGIRLYPSYDGLNGYNNKLPGLADDWDVGLFVDNAVFGLTDILQVVGYWRVAGLLLSHARTNVGRYESGSEHNKFVRSMFQGFRGVSIRGGDFYRVTAVTSDTIEIPWTISNPVPAQSNIENAVGLRSGSTIFQWTGATRNGDKLTLTGVTPSPTTNGIVIGTIMRNNIYTTGLGGTNFQDCYICGLDHCSSKPSDELGLGLGVSAALEANNARGIKISGNTKIATREQLLLFLLEADEWEITADLEPVTWIKSDGSAGSTGGRIIATPQAASDAAVLYPAGNTNRLNLMSDYYSQYLDLEPYYTRENTRFNDTGLFDPREIFYKAKALPSSDIGAVLRGGKKNGVRLKRENGEDVIVIYPSGTTEFKFNTNFTNGMISTTGGSMQLRTGTTSRFTISSDSGNIYPATDNTQSMGIASNRLSQVYAGSGTINTSDRNEKQQIGAIPDKVLDAWAEVQYKQFKFNDAVALKGDEARIHIGLIAQEIKEAFEKRGLNATDYGIICYDEWEEQAEERDEEGNIIKPGMEAGGRWGIRADECQFLELALMRRELERLKDKL